jgi:hypothetical protein
MIGGYQQMQILGMKDNTMPFNYSGKKIPLNKLQNSKPPVKDDHSDTRQITEGKHPYVHLVNIKQQMI